MQRPQLKNKIGKSANSRKAKPKYYISKTIIWLIKNYVNAIQPSKSVKRDKKQNNQLRKQQKNRTKEL